FRQGLAELGWIDGRNLKIDYRFVPADASGIRTLASDLVATRPELILVNTTPALAAAQGATGTIPIVFNQVTDPVAQGFVASLTRPGGNITGVMLYESSVTGKWLAMLKEIAPSLVRAAVLTNPKTATYYDYYLRAGEALGPSLGIDVVFSPFE